MGVIGHDLQGHFGLKLRNACQNELVQIVQQPTGVTLQKIPPKLFFADSGRGSRVDSGSAWCPAGIIGHFEKSKMASKMAAATDRNLGISMFSTILHQICIATPHFVCIFNNKSILTVNDMPMNSKFKMASDTLTVKCQNRRIVIISPILHQFFNVIPPFICIFNREWVEIIYNIQMMIKCNWLP